jgi:hypothetical protein
MNELDARRWKLSLCGCALALASHWTPMPWALPIYIAALTCFGRTMLVSVAAMKDKP